MNTSILDLLLICFFSGAFLALCASVAVMALMGVRKTGGPWVVTRVKADGSGGVEFLEHDDTGGWTSDVKYALVYHSRQIVDNVAEAHNADSVPLSRFKL